MWVVITGDHVGTSDLWVPEVMSGAYTRDNRPEWVRGEDGLVKAQMSADVGEALCERHPHIVPLNELRDADADTAAGSDVDVSTDN